MARAAFRAVTNAVRSRNLLELRDNLERMHRDIRESESYGKDFEVSPSLRLLALEQRLPDALLAELNSQLHLRSYDEKLQWVQNRV